jgi:hypothetical protein
MPPEQADKEEVIRAGRCLCCQDWIMTLSDTAERDDPMRAWLSLPRRIYLDTSTLQNLYDFGGEIFEGEPFELGGRAARVQGLAAEIGALRMIFMINQGTMFEFVVTEASLREVVNRTRPGYTQWVCDVLDTWLIQSYPRVHVEGGQQRGAGPAHPCA